VGDAGTDDGRHGFERNAVERQGSGACHSDCYNEFHHPDRYGQAYGHGL